MGSAEYMSFSMVAPRVALLVSSAGGAAETVTVCDSAPTRQADVHICDFERVDVDIFLRRGREARGRNGEGVDVGVERGDT